LTTIACEPIIRGSSEEEPLLNKNIETGEIENG